MAAQLTQAEVRTVFMYDEKTGDFTHILKNPPAFPGRAAGTLSARGYRVVKVNYVQYKLHQLAWVYVNGAIPRGLVIDHINRDKADNRISNLRLVSSSQNAENRGLSSKNTSGIKGVSLRPNTGKWRAAIMSRGLRLEFGPFDTKEEAAKAYAAAANQMHTHNPAAQRGHP